MSLHSLHKTRGFTLVEMLVSIGIFGTVVTTILLNQSQYTEAAALTSLADEVAARVSEAQAYGIGVKELGAGSSDFSGSYGIALNLFGSPVNNTAYIIFADKNSDHVYTGNWLCVVAECLEKVPMLRGNYLASICIIKSNGNDDCSAPMRADISFLRPSTAAWIKVWNSGGQELSPGNMVGVRYVFKSPRGLSRSVAIYFNGQVSVQNP